MFRALPSFALACLLPVILAAGSCLACFSIVSQKPASMCCKHQNECQDKASHSDCVDQAANARQATLASPTVVQAIPELVSEPLALLARPGPAFPVPVPPGGEASPPGLFVLHSSLLI